MNDADSKDVLVDFICPYCTAPISFSGDSRGSVQECPHCCETVIVPREGGNMGSKLPLPLGTARLILRAIRDEDIVDWLQVVTDEMSYAYLDRYVPDVEEAKAWLRDSKTRRLTQLKGYLPIGIELQSEAKLIGYLSFYFCDHEEHRQGTFNVMIHPAYRSVGYGTEAINALIDFGLNFIGLHDIRVGIDSRNLAACRMIEKTGMKLQATFVEDRHVKGVWITTNYFVIYWNQRT